MPSAICKGCGRETNSATSNYWDKDGKPTECYVVWEDNGTEDGKRVKGCAYERCTGIDRQFADKLLKGGER